MGENHDGGVHAGSKRIRRELGRQGDGHGEGGLQGRSQQRDAPGRQALFQQARQRRREQINQAADNQQAIDLRLRKAAHDANPVEHAVSQGLVQRQAGDADNCTPGSA